MPALLLHRHAAALLIFFPRAAWARIIASNLSSGAADLLYRLGISGAGHAGLLQFAAFFAAEFLLEIINGSGALGLVFSAIGCRSSTRPGGLFHHLHEVEVADGIFLEALHHGFEHVEGLALILHQRIVLRITAQSDAFFEMV